MGEPLGDDVPRTPSVGAAVPFAGRTVELAELNAGLDSVIGGRGRLYLVTGEPGIGKTRLADEFSTQAEQAGALALWGRSWEGGGAPEYWPWVQVVRSLARQLGPQAVADRLGEAAERFARLVPELRHGATVAAPPPEFDAESARFALFAGVSALLRDAAVGRPLVLVLDDLHAADRSSFLLLRFLASELRKARLLVLGTYREAEARLRPNMVDLFEQVAREGTTLELLGLCEEEVRELVRKAVGTSAPAELVAEVHRTTEGNPLFVGEIVRLLAARGPGFAFEIPARVRDTIRRRLNRLDAETEDVLRVAATIGKEFDGTLLGSAVGTDADTLARRLGDAEAAGIARSFSLGRWSFAHGLFREVLLEDLSPTWQARIHASVGEAMERLHARDAAPPLAELAHHFSLSAEVVGPERAVTYSLRAGERAIRALAYDEAVGHFDRAFGLLAEEERDRRSACLLRLGDARARAGDLPGAREAVEHAVERARETGEPDRLAEAALALGQLNLGEVWTRPWAADERLVAILEEAVAALGDAGSVVAARATALLAAALHFSDRRDEGVGLSGRALALAERLGDPATLAFCLGTRHLAAWSPDNLDARLAIATDLVRLAAEVENEELHLQARVWRMADLLEASRIAEADEELEAYALVAEGTRRPQLRAYVAFLRAQRAVFDGQLDEADRLADNAYRLAEQVGDENILGSYWCLILPMRRWQGRLADIEAGYREAYRRYAPNVGWRLALCWMCSQLGKEEETRRLLDGVVEGGTVRVPRDAYFLGMLPFLADACAGLGDAERARVVLETYRPFAERHVIAGRDGVCLWGSAARPLGVLAASAGRLDEGVALLEQAIEANRRMGTRPWLAEAQIECARILLTRGGIGDRERARAFLSEATEAARELGMQGLLERLDGLLSAEPQPTAAIPNVFHREGEYWTIAFAGRSVRMRDAKGLGDIAALLRVPGREMHAADLVASSEGVARERPIAALEPELARAGSPTEPLLDGKARAAYRARLVELQEDLSEAERHNDPERAAKAREEMDFIAGELAASLGLGGRPRHAADPAERARKAVTQRIRNALRRIEHLHPELAAHLERSLRTGQFCSYSPEHPTTWSL